MNLSQKLSLRGTVDGYDVDRARESAQILRHMFDADSVAVAMGYGVRAGDRSRAEEAGVELFVIESRRQSPASSP